MPKLTFSLDEETVEALRKAAHRTRKPQSLIVREAIAQYATREDRLSDPDRARLLGVLRRIRKRAPTRSEAAVDRELKEIRRSRRRGQESLLPSADVRGFGAVEAARAAHLYRALKRPRGRDMDIAIAACALEHGARLWTLDPGDFLDVPGLALYDPA